MATETRDVRTHFIDPDFRHVADAEATCCVCGRSVGFRSRRVRITHEGASVVHPDDATDENSLPALVGADCARKIPAEFLGPA